MDAITADEVKSIAALSRVALTEQEVDRATSDLSAILSNFSAIKTIETTNVSSSDDASGLRNIAREDIAQEEVLCSSDDLIKLIPHTNGRYSKVPGVFSESEVS